MGSGRKRRAAEERKKQEGARIKQIREIRDEAHRAFTRAFAVLSGSVAVTLVITEPTGEYDEHGNPQGQTREMTVCHAPHEIRLAHMLQASTLLYEHHNEIEKQLLADKAAAAAKEASELPTPEGMEDDTSEGDAPETGPPEPNVDGAPGQPLPDDDGGE